jgi:CRP/FNR family transcriptional regulator, cyclic AMP receptor protein
MAEELSDTSNILSTIPLFQGLRSDELAWIARRAHRRLFPAGTSVLVTDQPGEAVYIILHGTVKIFIDQANKKSVVLSIIGAGDTLGEISLLDSSGHSASAVTLEDSLMLWMDKPSFHQMLDEIPRVCRNLVNIMGTRLRMNNELIQSLATLDAYGRVARQFLAFVDRYDPHSECESAIIPIALTQRDIADLVGASRKRVNQVIGFFRDQELISVNSTGKITILNREGLLKYCE